MTACKILILITVFVAAACKKDDAKPEPKAPPAAAGKISILVTEDGFEPDDIKVTKGELVTLVFERKTDETCAKEVIIHVDDANKIEKKLPLNEPVEIAVTFPKSGDLTYACGMDMVKGAIHVQ